MSEILDPWREYARLAARAESIFKKVAADYPDEVRCRPGCDDCCHAPFRLSAIETAAVRAGLDVLDDGTRLAIIERAEARLDEAAAVFSQTPDDPRQAALTVARRRLKCPLLSDGRCALYPLRPITCRLYGLPTSSFGVSHTCPESGFEPGLSYPTVNLDAIAARLDEISSALIERGGLERDLLNPRTMPEALLGDLPAALRPEVGQGGECGPDRDGSNRVFG